MADVDEYELFGEDLQASYRDARLKDLETELYGLRVELAELNACWQLPGSDEQQRSTLDKAIREITERIRYIRARISAVKEFK